MDPRAIHSHCSAPLWGLVLPPGSCSLLALTHAPALHISHSCQWTDPSPRCPQEPLDPATPGCPRLLTCQPQVVLSSVSSKAARGHVIKNNLYSLSLLSLFSSQTKGWSAHQTDVCPDVSSHSLHACLSASHQLAYCPSSCPLPFTHHSESQILERGWQIRYAGQEESTLLLAFILIQPLPTLREAGSSG